MHVHVQITFYESHAWVQEPAGSNIGTVVEEFLGTFRACDVDVLCLNICFHDTSLPMLIIVFCMHAGLKLAHAFGKCMCSTILEDDVHEFTLDCVLYTNLAKQHLQWKQTTILL